MVASGERSPPANAEARSSRSNGKRHSLATALALRDFPQPWTPSSRSPRGAGRPKRRASAPKARRRSRSQRLSSPRPPTSPRPEPASWKVSAGMRRNACRFSRTIDWMAASVSPWPRTNALRNTRTASEAVSPRDALAASPSRPCASSPWASGPATRWRSPVSSCSRGRDSSTRPTSRTSSSGTSSTGPTRTMACWRFPSFGTRSRRRRTAWGSLRPV
jgi:hypothetical protein